MTSEITKFLGVMFMWLNELKIFAVVMVIGGLLGCSQLPNAQFAVACYNDDGSLEESFGGDGRVLIDFRSAESEGAHAIAFARWFYGGSPGERPEGNMVVVGDATVGDGYQFALARYKEWDGSLEELFDGDGKILTDFPSAQSESALDVAPVYNGHGPGALHGPTTIVVAGKALVGDGHQFALARYLWNGDLDTSFDGDGRVLTDFPSATDEVARAIAIAEFDEESKIVAAGDALVGDGRQFALARYDWDGSLDSSFGVDGMVLTDLPSAQSESISDIALTTIDGEVKIVAAGGGFVDDVYRFAVARYNSDGSLDSSFNGGDIVLTHFPPASSEYAYATVIDADGRVVVAGYARVEAGGDQFALARYNSDGSLDSSFGVDGRVLTDFTSASGERVFDMDIDREDRILVAGRAAVEAGYRFAVARYNPDDGSLDTTFDGDGKVLTNFPSKRHAIARGINYWADHLCVSGEAGGRLE